MLIIKIKNVGEIKQIADYEYQVLVNLDEIASGGIIGHKRADGWITLVQKLLIDAQQQQSVEKKAKFAPGDVVCTIKGNQRKGIFEELLVLEVGRTWHDLPAVLCRKENWTKHLYLEKNLELVEKVE